MQWSLLGWWVLSVLNEFPTFQRLSLPPEFCEFCTNMAHCQRRFHWSLSLQKLHVFHLSAVVMNISLLLGDLTISISVLYNYLENSSKIPWEDLRYLFGEIMYGGHITDGWDRRLCCTFLQEWLQVISYLLFCVCFHHFFHKEQKSIVVALEK